MIANSINHLYILCDHVLEPDHANYLQNWLNIHNIKQGSHTIYPTTL